MTIENNLADLGGFGLFSKSLPQLDGALTIRTEVFILHVLAKRRNVNQRIASDIINCLGINVLVGKRDAQARALGGAGNLLADSPDALLAQGDLVFE